VEGRVDSATAPEFGQKLDAMIADGVFKIVIDMTKLEYMSSAGFRALLGAQRQCKRYNRGEVILAEAQRRGWRIAHLWYTHAHFDHVLAVDEVRAATGAPWTISGGIRITSAQVPVFKYRASPAFVSFARWVCPKTIVAKPLPASASAAA